MPHRRIWIIGAGLLSCGSGQDVPINLLIGKAVETEAADGARLWSAAIPKCCLLAARRPRLL
ncbi:hypothetical protein ACRQ5Q_19485 [Bradyrhizobium sp. PMVTL-01]|uniref:hypothetical protein n=1 Tax=Bradyrhizobium sp. PMVTL-01 TaxID=3434999 RepID=UPI003F7051FD